MKHKIELLAPAGSFEGFKGAVNAGADAVYLAGEKFGARAYADNFTQDEILQAIFLAKLHDVKVYLTVNTLLKNREMNELYDYIAPLYEAGLDGVIIQDFGVLQFLEKQFPELELHASTQMTVTSVEGAKYLKDNHIKRVVLSRELTLKEIKEIVAQDIETECFVHGSMCYCYSGQCLFSSLIGGRSGNRGRCAQPCRLPYRFQDDKNEKYLLSLKDMCTLEHIPELVESGISSFKIEGRMKNPAYAAWVTHIYRKYINQYLSNPSGIFQVEAADMEQLKHLYIRTSVQDGYYHKYRGKNMVTLENPAYSKTDEEFVTWITEHMLQKPLKKSVIANVSFRVGKPCCMNVSVKLKNVILTAETYGDIVMEAIKAPLSVDTIKEKLSKTGDTPFEMEELNIEADENAFLPVKALNELRRTALNELENKLRNSWGRTRQEKMHSVFERTFAEKQSRYIAFVEEQEQLSVVLEDALISRVVIPYSFFSDDKTQQIEKVKGASKEIYLVLPAICRNDSYNKLRETLDRAIALKCCDGFYVNQIDSLAFCRNMYPDLPCVGDINLYNTNTYSNQWLEKRINGFTVSVELNKDELRHLPLEKGEMILYGRTPLMHTANCIFLTTGECQKNHEKKTGVLKDRTGATMPFRGHCEEKVCYNTIYNSVATSLHKHKKEIERFGCNAYQLRFTIEKGNEVKKILSVYKDFASGKIINEVDFPYTNGHFLRGVQ